MPSLIHWEPPLVSCELTLQGFLLYLPTLDLVRLAFPLALPGERE